MSGPEALDAKLVIACHDELVVKCPEGQAKDVAKYVEETMIDGKDWLLKPGLNADHPERVPVKVDVEVVESWSG